MSRYTGPRVKKLRALGVNLPGLSRKTIDKRPYAPGQHGQNRRRKLSDFGKQLMEKQKLRINYGIGERQFRRVVAAARSAKLDTGAKILELLERRLDNVVFRAGFAPTIPAARQLVAHGHIMVNGRQVDIPSYSVDTNDVIRPRDKSLRLACIEESLASPSLMPANWLESDPARRLVRVSALPAPDSVPFEIDVQLVVEYYSKRM
jgi:small subunit ribosomal protein S4